MTQDADFSFHICHSQRLEKNCENAESKSFATSLLVKSLVVEG